MAPNGKNRRKRRMTPFLFSFRARFAIGCRDLVIHGTAGAVMIPRAKPLCVQLILINLISLFPRWHGDIRVLLRPHWDSAVRECSAISVDGATTDLRPVEARRCEVNDGTVSEMILIAALSLRLVVFCDCFVSLRFGEVEIRKKWNDRNQFSLQSRAGTCLPQARDCDGRDVDCWCAFVGDRRTALHLVATTQSLLEWTVLINKFSYYSRYFSDIVNSLQGLFIFIVVGCQPQVSFLFSQTMNSLSAMFTQKSLFYFVTGVVRPEAAVDVTIRRSSDDGNDQRSTALHLVPWHSIDGRQHHQQHNHKLQSRASRDDVLIELEASSDVNDSVACYSGEVRSTKRIIGFYYGHLITVPDDDSSPHTKRR